MIERVEITEKINAPLSKVFDWFYKSENFIKSPIVFKADWRKKSSKWINGAQRDIIMIAGWYAEEITDIKKDTYIRYKVNRSFPTVRQDFTEIAFEKISDYSTKITWIIEIEVPIPLGKKTANRLAGKMAKTLYKTILTAGKKELEKNGGINETK